MKMPSSKSGSPGSSGSSSGLGNCGQSPVRAACLPKMSILSCDLMDFQTLVMCRLYAGIFADQGHINVKWPFPIKLGEK